MMIFKNAVKLFYVIFFLFFSFPIFSQTMDASYKYGVYNTDVLLGIGFSNYNITNSSSHPYGENINTAILKSIYKVHEQFDFILGPTLKYEAVTQRKSQGGLVSYDSKEKFSTLQLGAEGGLKYRLFNFVLYETLGLSYGAYSSLSTQITNGGFLIPDQTVKANVHNSLNVALNTQALLLFNPVLNFGFSLSVGYGSYRYDGSTVQTVAGNMNTDPGRESFLMTNLGLVAVLNL